MAILAQNNLTMSKLEKSVSEFRSYMEEKPIQKQDVDYKKAEKHLQLAKLIDKTNTSIVIVQDLYKKEFFYFSEKFDSSFGFNRPETLTNFDWFVLRFHPQDFIITDASIKTLEIIRNSPIEIRKDFMFTSEVRIKNNENNWIRLLSQEHIIELDKKGNVWLIMMLIDISPIRDLNYPGSAALSNKITKEIIFSIESPKDDQSIISKREQDVLKLIAKGDASKAIAEKLFISTNTVNNHRKNAIKKLNVKNSSEAIVKALKLGII